MANVNKTIIANNGIDEIHYKTNAGQVILSNKNTVEGEIARIKSSKADTNHNHDSNYLKLTGGTMTGALRLKGAKITSTIKSNALEGREELQIYATGDAYMEGSRGAGIHLYGNNDVKHGGNIALLTGSNENGTARMIISEKGNVTLGNALWNFVDEGKDVGLLNIKGKSGSPALLFHKVAKEDGEIAVPLTENLALGHYDTDNNVFTSRFEINGSGNIVSHGEIQMNNNAVRLTTEKSSYARIGYEASSGDVYISNANNNWLRIKSDKTITIGGSKVYTALDKPTPAEIGAIPNGHFGLGTYCVTPTDNDWNNAKVNGFYMTNTGKNAPHPVAWAYGVVIAHNDKYVTQRLFTFSGNKKWYVRHLYNGTWGAWELEVAELGALPTSGGTMTGDLILNKQRLMGANDTAILRDHGNGNVSLSAGKNSDGVVGSLYLGYNPGASYVTKNVQLESPLTWRGQKSLVDSNGNIPWSAITGKPTPAEIGALPLSGGTVTGVVNLRQGSIVHTADNAGGVNGYLHVAEFKIIGAYKNQPIYIAFSQRRHTQINTVEILFSNSNNTDPTLDSIVKTGSANIYIHKSATSTWNLYIKKTEAYDYIDIVDFKKGKNLQGIVVTWKDINVTTLPTGYVAASNKTIISNISGNATTANTLQTARTINGTKFNGSTDITTTQWGESRTIKIGNAGKPVNGGEDVTWTLTEIGALPLTGGKMLNSIIMGNNVGYQGNDADGNSRDLIRLNPNNRLVLGWNGMQNTPMVYKGSTAYEIYHKGNQPTPVEIGAAATNHTHDDRYFRKVKDLAANVNLNTLTATGRYHQATTNNATIALNYPVARAGLLKVYNDGYIYQEYHTFDNSGVYRRTCYNGTWYGWVNLQGSTGSAALNEVSASTTASGFTNGHFLFNNNGKVGAKAITAAEIGALASNGTAVNASKLNSKAESATATANTIVSRDSSGDVIARLLRTTYADQSDISGAIAFRINNSTNNYTRYCNNPSAVRTWLGAAASSHTHNYVPTSDYTLTTISKTLTIGTSWIDTGIAGTNLDTGSYMVQVSGMDHTATSFYSEIWTGTMSWYNGTTNSIDADEIILHKAGHASNDRTIYLRTIRTSSGGYLRLQICASASFASTNVTFKFRKLM